MGPASPSLSERRPQTPSAGLLARAKTVYWRRSAVASNLIDPIIAVHNGRVVKRALATG
jgi:hypothetical protein